MTRRGTRNLRPAAGVLTGAMNAVLRPLLATALGVAVLTAAAPAAGGPGAAAQTPASDAEAIAGRADQALAALRSLEAGFVQRVENRALERTSTGRGTLSFAAPDRLRIDYREPAGDLVVNDGTHVWIYLPSSQPGQVIRQPAAQSGVQNPLTYLRDLRGRYAIRHAGQEPVAGEATDHLVLEPRARSAPFARVDVWVGRSTGLLRQVRTTAEGLTTTYTFQNFERNIQLPDDRFRFRPPDGVDVFDS